MPKRGYVLVVTVDAQAAPAALFFAGLARTEPRAIRMAQYRRDRMASLIGGASAIVFVRGLFEFADIVACAGWLGIPRYYFLDDHFILVREQGGPAAVFAKDHSAENVAAILRGFDGVLASTAPLRADFERRGLHHHVRLFPPTEMPAVASKTEGPLRIAFFGGSHLHDMFRRSILPAVRRLARTQEVTLIAVGVPEAIDPSDGLRVRRLPYEPSYEAGLTALAREGVDILVHPVAPGLLSNPFKNPHALITANALGAVPVVSDTQPYASLRDENVAVMCGNSEDAWYRGLLEAVDPSRGAMLRQRLARHCQMAYGGAVNEQVWNELLDMHAAPPASTALLRTLVAAAWLAASWVRRGCLRVAGLRPAVFTG